MKMNIKTYQFLFDNEKSPANTILLFVQANPSQIVYIKLVTQISQLVLRLAYKQRPCDYVNTSLIQGSHNTSDI